MTTNDDKCRDSVKPLAQYVRDWVDMSEGYFDVSQVYRDLRILTRSGKQACCVALRRMCTDGLLKKDAKRNGIYRRINSEASSLAWKEADPENYLKLCWPFELENYVRIYRKNIITLGGAPNCGKTAFLLNFTELNMRAFDIVYFCYEMGPEEFKLRVSKSDTPIGDWKVDVRSRTRDFGDVIRPNSLNIIDFLKLSDEFYKVGRDIQEIYEALDQGIAIIALQKNPGVELARGGIGTIEEARLSLSMDDGRLRITKGKLWADQTQNPRNKEWLFKLVNGYKFVQVVEQ